MMNKKIGPLMRDEFDTDVSNSKTGSMRTGSDATGHATFDL
jgi:hypothetical protein